MLNSVIFAENGAKAHYNSSQGRFNMLVGI